MSVNFTRFGMIRYTDVPTLRDLGIRAGRNAQDDLADAAGVAVSFEGVVLPSPLFLEEFLAGLWRLAAPDVDSTLLVLTDMTVDTRAMLDYVLSAKKTPMAMLDEDGTLRLLSGTSQLNETFDAAVSLGTFLAPDLADRLGLRLNALHQRLQPLLACGALSRTRDASVARGKRYVHVAPAVADVRIATAAAPDLLESVG